MKERIYLNGRFLTQALTGVQRVAIEITKNLDEELKHNPELNNKYEFVLIHPKGLIHELDLKKISKKETPFFNGNLWEQLVLPFYTFGHLLISMCMVSCLFKRKQIVIIHDASALVNKDFFKFSFRLWYRIALTALGRIAKHIVTMSNHAKSELIKHAHIPAHKITVVYLSGKHLLNVKTSLDHEKNFIDKHKLHQRFVLAVSSLSPNKNFKNIIEAFNNIKKNTNVSLIIAGASNKKVFKGVSNFDEHVKYLGYVSDEELIYLYKNAAVFVFPSFYEGFGIPPIEAMLFGCPVVVSNTSSIPEVCKDAAVYCNPYDINDIASKIRKVLWFTKDEREQIQNKGYERTEQLDWGLSTKQILKIILKVEIKIDGKKN